VFPLAGCGAPRARARRRTLEDLREGSSFVFRHRLLLPILITQFVFNTAFFVLQAVYVPHAVHRLGLSASGVGVTLADGGDGGRRRCWPAGSSRAAVRRRDRDRPAPGWPPRW
jgi:hypothetical protein